MYFYSTYIRVFTITAFAIIACFSYLLLSQTIILNKSSVKYSLNTFSGDSGMAMVGIKVMDLQRDGLLTPRCWQGYNHWW